MKSQSLFTKIVVMAQHRSSSQPCWVQHASGLVARRWLLQVVQRRRPSTSVCSKDRRGGSLKMIGERPSETRWIYGRAGLCSGSRSPLVLTKRAFSGWCFLGAAQQSWGYCDFIKLFTILSRGFVMHFGDDVWGLSILYKHKREPSASLHPAEPDKWPLLLGSRSSTADVFLTWKQVFSRFLILI